MPRAGFGLFSRLERLQILSVGGHQCQGRDRACPVSPPDGWPSQGHWEPHLLSLPDFPHSKSCPLEHRQDLTYILQLVGKARVPHLDFAGSWEEELFFSSGLFLSSFCKKKRVEMSN